MRLPRKNMMYWQNDRSWYGIDNREYFLTDKAPDEAKKSFQEYQIWLKKKKKIV